MWSSGDFVALREIWKARPWIVVGDAPDLLVLWLPAGSRTMVPAGKPVLPVGDWKLTEGRFGVSDAHPGTSALRLTRPGASHSILLFFGADFYAWYVNLERPLTRSPAGFDLTDLFLDIYIEPGRDPRWLDEDELEQALEAGLLTDDEAAAARTEGERVLAEWPFPTGWEDFRPDPRWELPELPAGWDVVD
jgi:Protein of unknown function (DUF402)